jgi:hypothetical protein
MCACSTKSEILPSPRNLGREIVAALLCTLWAALGFSWCHGHTAIRQELKMAQRRHRAFARHANGLVRSITT